jgi:hypothetical protein
MGKARAAPKCSEKNEKEEAMKSTRSTVGMNCRTLAMVAGGIVCLASAGASGQTRDWLNPVAGNWSGSVNWSGSDIPNTTTENASLTAAGAYLVSMDGNYSIGSLVLPSNGGSLQILDGRSLGVYGAITNNRTIEIGNGLGVGGTVMAAGSVLTPISGNGSLVLRANPANLDTAYLQYVNSGAQGFSNGAGHSIRGVGRVYCVLDNSGTVNADNANGPLELRVYPKSNSGLMTATNGGLLRLVSGDFTQTGSGSIVASTGSVVEYNSIGLTGGVVNATGTGISRLAGSSAFTSVANNGAFQITDGSTLVVSTSFVNNGLLVINPTSGANATVLRSNTVDLPLTGTGTIELRANAGNLDTAYLQYNNNGAQGFTQSATHTIRGTGRIPAAFINNGTINANVNGRTLELFSYDKTNNALMTATNGGILRFTSGTYTQGALGQIVSNASTVDFVNVGIAGGAVTNSGGLMRLLGSSTFTGVLLSGTLDMLDGSNLYIGTGITNNGTIRIGDGTGINATILRSNAVGVPINGTGSIELRANPSNLDTAYLLYNNNGNQSFVQAASHTIRGTGRIPIAFTNNGTVNANVNGRTLELLTYDKTNNALMTATNGGTLRFLNASYTQGPSGQITANGGTVEFGSMGLTGGTLNNVGGTMRLTGSSTFVGVVSNGAFDMLNGSNLFISNGITNNGTIRISDGAGPNATILRANAVDVPINGTGTIVLDATTNLDTAYFLYNNNGNQGFVQGASHTIRGTGRLAVVFANNGTVNANVNGRAIELLTYPKINNALMTATSGGILRFVSSTCTQGPSGQIVANGGIVEFNAMGLSGGSVNAINSGTVRLAGASTFDNMTNIGTFNVTDGSNLYTSGFTNNGIVRVGTGTGGSGTYLRANAADVPINGTGSIVLDSSANLDTGAMLYNNSGAQGFLITANQTLAGNGRATCPMKNSGVIAPGRNLIGGSPIGHLDFVSYPVTLNASSRVNMNLNGTAAGQFDTMRATSGLAINGVLNLTVGGALVPADGQTFQIITGGGITSRFRNVTLSNAPLLAAIVEYTPTLVTVRISSCDSLDFNNDGNIDPTDVDAYFSVLGEGPCIGLPVGYTCGDLDYNNDGNIDPTDVDAYFSILGEGPCLR